MVTMVTIDPVGATEIAARCGVDLGTIKKWQQRHRAGYPDFPKPRRLVGNRPAWDWALDIVPWLTATGRPMPDVTIQPWSQETTMQAISVVEVGEYSDYRVLAIFEDPGDAEAYADDYNSRLMAGDDHATVGQLVFYPAGTFHLEGTVVDGELIERSAIGP